MPVSTITTIIALVRRIAFSLVTKFLQLVLPLPLFPAVSSLLAQAFGIDPLTLSSLHIPTIPIPPFAPLTFHDPMAGKKVSPPFKQDLASLRQEFEKGANAAVVNSEAETMPLLEKVRSWRAFNHDNHRMWQGRVERRRNSQGEGGNSAGTPENGGGARRPIDQVEFNSEDPASESKSVLKEAKDSMEALIPKVSPSKTTLLPLFPCPTVISSHLLIPLPFVHPSIFPVTI
jgi:hypothetical protein